MAATAAPATRQALDGVVAAVGNAAITQSDVHEEYRFEIFFDTGRLPDASPDAATYDRVRDRLIDQRLLGQEAEAEGIEPASGFEPEARERLAELRRKCGSDAAFASALRGLGISEAELLARLEDEDRTLRLIDQRLRPLVVVEQAAIEEYYCDTFVNEFKKQNPGPAPPLDQVEGQIRELLVQKKIDALLAAWLKELRASRGVKILRADS